MISKKRLDLVIRDTLEDVAIEGGRQDEFDWVVESLVTALLKELNND